MRMMSQSHAKARTITPADIDLPQAFKSNWDWLLYGATAVNYGALLYGPYWLGGRLGCEVQLPDLSPALSASDFEVFRSCLHQPIAFGLQLFGQLHTFGADLFFPALLALSLTRLTYTFAARSRRFLDQATVPKLALIAFMPFAYALTDYAENALVWRKLSSVQNEISIGSISSVTTLKFAFFAIALAILFMFLLASLKHRPKE
jgi:hypothetical protein